MERVPRAVGNFRTGFVLGAAAGFSPETLMRVFDGTGWKAGPRLPLGLDHASAATLGDHVYVAGGHSFGGDSARFFRIDGSSWTELPSTIMRGRQALPSDAKPR